MAYLEQVFIEGSTGAVLDSAAGTPNAHALTIQGNSSGVAVPVSAAITGTVTVVGDAASGSAVAGNPVLVGGSDGTDARTIATDTGGQVKVLVENTVPVTGTFYQATQPVSGTVVAEIEGHAGATLDGAAGSPSTQCLTIQGNSSGTAVPVTGTFYPTTQPVEITGHAGATLDGTAGSPSTGVLTIQGVGSGTAVPVSGTFYQATQPVSGTVTAEIEGHGGATLDAAPGAAIPTNAVMVGGSDGTDLRAIATDTGGQVKVLIENASAIPVSLSGNQAVNIAQVAGATPSKTNGLFVVPGDNTNSITMKAASAASVAADTSLVVQINPGQPNLATALNVQDVADGPVSAGSAATKSMLTGGVVATSAASGTAAQQMATQMDVAGCVRVNPAGQTGSFKSYSNTVAGNVQNVITVGAGKKWILKSVVIIVGTNATAGTRTPSCYIQDASSRVMCNINAGLGTTANIPATYFNFAPSMPLSTSVVSSCVTVPLPEFALGPSATVNGNVTSGLAGDSSLMTICVIEYND